MNAYEIAEMAWDTLGRKTDLGTPNPADGSLTLTATQRAIWRSVINRALMSVCFWKDRAAGGPVINHILEGQLLCKNTLETVTLETDASTSLITLPAGYTGYGGYVIDTGTEQRLIQGDGVAYNVVEGFSSAPESGDEVTLLKNWITTTEMGSPSDFYEPFQVFDLGNEKNLKRGKRGSRFISKSLTSGDPTSWYIFGTRIYFDQLLDEELYFRVEYAKSPDMVETADFLTPTSGSRPEVDLPDPYHYGLVLWATEWGYRRYGESNEKYSVKRDFIDFMRSVQSQSELSFARSDSNLVFKRE